MALRLDAQVDAAIRAHGSETYPNECCGALIGRDGNVSDTLNALGVRDTVFSDRFRALRQGMQLVGRALPIKLHSLVEPRTREHQAELEAKWEAEGGHPQKRMMRAVAAAENGTVLCFDCGGDMQPAHFGEMSCQLAYAHGCRGMLLAGNCRDTQYVLKMPDFPIFSFGTRPNAFGGWVITEVNTPIYLPGHGGPVHDATRFVESYIRHRQAREVSILRRLGKGAADIATLVRAIYIGIDPRPAT